MIAYYTVLIASLAGALWLIPGARSHVLLLFSWLVISMGLDALKASEMKLFLDFYASGLITIQTIVDVTQGRYWIGKKACAYLSLASTGVSALGYGFSKVFAVLHLPYEVFNVLIWTHGWLLNILFLLAGLALFWGSDGLARLRDRVGSFVRLVSRYSGVSPAQETYATSQDDGVQLGPRVFQAGGCLSVSASTGGGDD